MWYLSCSMCSSVVERLTCNQKVPCSIHGSCNMLFCHARIRKAVYTLTRFATAKHSNSMALRTDGRLLAMDRALLSSIWLLYPAATECQWITAAACQTCEKVIKKLMICSVAATQLRLGLNICPLRAVHVLCSAMFS